MAKPFDSEMLVRLGWRQGSILGPELARLAREYAPARMVVDDADRFIVTSHDCDIVNFGIDKEPVVEVLRAGVTAARKVDKPQSWGRNPRALQIAVDVSATGVVLTCSVHDRWNIPRELLLQEQPKERLADKERRLVAQWLAKRYIRAAFPTAFDLRWRAKLKDWQKLLQRNSDWLQGVYLRLDTLAEVPERTPYRCHILLAVPAAKRERADWPAKLHELQLEVQAFWDQFDPGIRCIGVDAQGTDEITLADIERYQRFDSDWVSFEDDTSTTPEMVDMTL